MKRGIRLRLLLSGLLLLFIFQPTLTAAPLSMELEVAPADGDFTPEQAGKLSFRAYVPGTPLEMGSGGSGVVLRVWTPRETGLGEAVNLMLCNTMGELLPVDAVIGRFGGDEFLVLLPGADYFHATELLARLNPSLQEQMVDNEVSMSVSIGIAECLSGREMPIAELLKLADLSLYAAKAAGKGCIGAKVDVAPTF